MMDIEEIEAIGDKSNRPLIEPAQQRGGTETAHHTKLRILSGLKSLKSEVNWPYDHSEKAYEHAAADKQSK